MSYLLAILVPPLALLLQGRPFQALFNGVLWLIGLVLLILPVSGVFVWGAAVLWAFLVVHARRSEARDRRLIEDALRRQQRG
jgi:hypothetical protein